MIDIPNSYQWIPMDGLFRRDILLIDLSMDGSISWHINELLGIVIGIIQWIVIFQRMIR